MEAGLVVGLAAGAAAAVGPPLVWAEWVPVRGLVGAFAVVPVRVSGGVSGVAVDTLGVNLVICSLFFCFIALSTALFWGFQLKNGTWMVWSSPPGQLCVKLGRRAIVMFHFVESEYWRLWLVPSWMALTAVVSFLRLWGHITGLTAPFGQ